MFRERNNLGNEEWFQLYFYKLSICFICIFYLSSCQIHGGGDSSRVGVAQICTVHEEHILLLIKQIIFMINYFFSL